MKKYIQTKQSKHAQIGHLYEHLYCHQLAQAFRSKGLFAYVDYSINGRTYYDGLIEIEVALYSSDSLKHKDLLKTLKIEYDEDSISGGLLQIMAEKRVDVWERDDNIIEHALEDLNTSAWEVVKKQRSVKNIETLESTEGLEFVERTQRSFLNMKQKIVFNPALLSMNNQSISPIFYVIATALRQNLQEEFACSFFYYSVKDSFMNTEKELTDVNIYRVDRRQASSLTGEDQVVRSLLNRMYENGFIERLSEFITTSLIGSPFGLPDNDTLRKSVGIEMDEKAWRQFGSQSHIKNILSATRIELSLGKSVLTVAFSEETISR